MAIDLPPAIPPQLTDTEVLEQKSAAAGSVIDIEVSGYRILISGNQVFSEERIREVVSKANNPSQAVLLLNALYVSEGYLLTVIQYASPKGQDIYVHVSQGMIEAVDAEPPYTGYFEELVGQESLQSQDLMADKILLEALANRTGDEVDLRYEPNPQNPQALTLAVEAEAQEDYNPLQGSVVFGNPGNRFLGRFFAFGNARYNTEDGGLYSLGYGTGLTGIGDARGGDDYDRINAGYSKVTPWGLYGLSAAYTTYALDEPAATDPSMQLEQDAEILEIDLVGQQVLTADKKSRWILRESINYVDSTIEFTDPPELAGFFRQDESYYSAQLGTTYTHNFSVGGRRANASMAVDYQQGFGGGGGTFDEDDVFFAGRTEDFSIGKAKINSAFSLPDGFVLNLEARGQVTNDRLPQQQQWVLGGPNQLAAFLPGILIGDTGAYGKAAFELPVNRLAGDWLSMSVFYEVGSANFEDVSGAGGERRTVSDIGLKFTIKHRDYLELSLYSAELVNDSNLSQDFLDDNEADLFFNLKLSW